MFDDVKTRLLQDKLNLLLNKQTKLTKAGRIYELNQVLNEINEIIAKMEKITGKKYNRALNKFDKTINKNNKKLDKTEKKYDKAMKKIGLSNQEDTEEAEKLLESLMEEKKQHTK